MDVLDEKHIRAQVLFEIWMFLNNQVEAEAADDLAHSETPSIHLGSR